MVVKRNEEINRERERERERIMKMNERMKKVNTDIKCLKSDPCNCRHAIFPVL
jgi:peptidoglycan hydrolase CwlO-like protein